MDTPTAAGERALPFRYPKRYFADIDPATTALMVASGVDVALVLDNGIIKDVAIGNMELIDAGFEEAWRGKPWLKTVSDDSFRKVEELLQARPDSIGRWRQITQVSAGGGAVPIRFTTVPTRKPGRLLALGQDLRSVATLQQRLIAMHQDLEREYARLKDAETRYRSLFDALEDPVVIVSARDGLVSEMNTAAQRRLGTGTTNPRGQLLTEWIEPSDRPQFQRFLDRALAQGDGEVAELGLLGRGTSTIRASIFREQNEVFAILWLQGESRASAAEPDSVMAREVQQVMEHLPDGLVVTTGTLRILSVNGTFLRMVQASGERSIIGDQLSNWIGRSASELNMLQSNLKRHGNARNFVTIIRDRFGVEEDIELSAVSSELGQETVFGFAIRSTSRRLISRENAQEWLPGRAEQVTSLVGSMPLKEIVRASTDLIEKLCIETALELSGQSRASAAEILGLSRQGLYSKLKRFQIADDE